MSDTEKPDRIRLEPDELEVESLEVEELEQVAGGATEGAECGINFIGCVNWNCEAEYTYAYGCSATCPGPSELDC